MKWRLLARHQIAAVAATALDFLVMIGCVELAGASPVTATAIGAGTGALSNFVLGRRWIFRAQVGSASGQAWRYALVSASSLGLNSAGEALALKTAGLSYLLARVVVAGMVGVSWNYPMHRHFVFRTKHGERSA